LNVHFPVDSSRAKREFLPKSRKKKEEKKEVTLKVLMMKSLITL
jgi:hypothetical protein